MCTKKILFLSALLFIFYGNANAFTISVKDQLERPVILYQGPLPVENFYVPGSVVCNGYKQTIYFESGDNEYTNVAIRTQDGGVDRISNLAPGRWRGMGWSSAYCPNLAIDAHLAVQPFKPVS